MSHSISRTLADVFSIVLIDLLLAGDNALVIAMAVRSLPARERRIGIILGATAAVALRVGLTFLAAQLLNIEFLKLVGGALVIWIAIRVFSDTDSSQHETTVARKFYKAIWVIVFADLTMSTDNVLAIAGASHGSIELIVFGLALSIPFVVASSNLLAMLMNRFPAVVYLGAAILGKVGAEMMLTDNFIARTLHPPQLVIYIAEAVAIGAVLLFSRLQKT